MNKLRMIGAVLSIFIISGAAHADDPVRLVRAARAESNAAMAAHDGARLRKTMHDDYHMIRGSSGNLWDGADTAVRGFTEDAFNDPTFVTYKRSPDRIAVASSGKRVAEFGKWVGTWRMHDGFARLSGIYLAMWTPKDGQWRLKSEAFVTLSCDGSDADCTAVE